MMINETSRLSDHAIKETLETEKELDLAEQMTIDNAESSGEVGTHLSYFFIELFICSLLLWSLLFISKSDIGVKVTHYVGNILDAECGIEKVEVFERNLEDAIRQII